MKLLLLINGTLSLSMIDILYLEIIILFKFIPILYQLYLLFTFDIVWYKHVAIDATYVDFSFGR